MQSQGRRKMGDTEPFIGETILADGWVYRDLPRMTPDAMEFLLSIIGDENIKFMTMAKYTGGAVRGQVWISPIGVENMKTHIAD
jgi:hypothetical protein